MKLFYYKAAEGNFGDDLNELLWNRLFGDILKKDTENNLVGIGSILDHRLNALKGRKIIFGTGISSQRRLPVFDSSYDIRFVRGPVSAYAIGQGVPWIADSGIAVRLLDWPEVKPIHEIGFMPHFLSIPFLDWPVVCQELGLQYISPQWPVEPVIHQLRSCKAVITEAMHGAIICDAFRIPWSRVTINAWQKEDFDVSTLKWLDWGLSLRADVTPVHLEPQHEWGRRMLANPLKFLERLASRRQLLKDLRQFVKTKKFYLSEEPLLKNATERIAAEIARLKSDYAAG